MSSAIRAGRLPRDTTSERRGFRVFGDTGWAATARHHIGTAGLPCLRRYGLGYDIYGLGYDIYGLGYDIYGLCYDIYISKGFSGVPTKLGYTRQKCPFSSFHQLLFRPPSITIPPTVRYHIAHPFFLWFLKYFDEKVIAQDFLGRGNLMP